MSALQLHFSSAQLQLAPNRPLRLSGAAGTRLRAVAGVVWVTMDGDPLDRVLEAGDSLLIESSGPVLVTALGGRSALAVCAPPTPATGIAATWHQVRAWAGRPASAVPAAPASC